MAVLQLIERETRRDAPYEIDVVDSGKLRSQEESGASPRFLRVSAGGPELLEIASLAGEFGFRLTNVELEYVSGRDADAPLAALALLISEADAESAVALLQNHTELFLAQIELVDNASRGHVHITRYGTVDLRGPSFSQATVQRVLQLVGRALGFEV